MSEHRVAIVGAGLAGLTAASTLVGNEAVAGAELIVVESNEQVGGRLATEIVDGARFDHGAQFFTVRTERLQQQVERWLASGAVVEWCRGFATVDGYPRYRGADGMRSLATNLVHGLRDAGVEIRTSTPVTVGTEGGRLALTGTGTGTGAGTEAAGPTDPIRAEALIVTPPVPEAMTMLRAGDVALDPEAVASIGPTEFHRVIAVLAVLDESPSFDPPGAYQQPDDPTFSFVADNEAKGVSDRPAVTFHTSHARSIDLWDGTDGDILSALRSEIERYCPASTIRSLHVRRWRYSGPVEAVAQSCVQVSSDPGPVVLAGDGFGGSKVEGAFSSGVAAADHLTGWLQGSAHSSARQS